MVTKIGANKGQFGLFLFCCLFVCTISFYIIHATVKHIDHATYGSITFNISLMLTFIFVLVVLIHTFIFLPSRLVFNTTTQEIEIDYLLKKKIYIYLADIESFTYTKIQTRSGYYQGDFIYLKDNKKILISEFSLEDHRPFEKWLEDEKVPYNGEEKGSLFTYYFQYLKRRKA